MIKYKKSLVLAFCLIFIGCSNSSSTTSSSSQGATTLSKTYSINTQEESKIEVEGKNGDKLTINIPANPFTSSKENVVFSLEYKEGNSLPIINVSEDINFSRQVTLSFQSDSLNEDEIVLVYRSDSQDYLIPFTKVGNVLTAKLWHFSKYAIVEKYSDEVLKEKIENGLKDVKSQLDKDGISKIDLDLLGEILAAIDQLGDTSYMNKLVDLLGSSMFDKVKLIENKDITYFEGYCPSIEFTNDIEEVLKYKTEGELMGYNNKEFDDKANQIVKNRITTLYEKFLEFPPPVPCDIAAMKEYRDCGAKISLETELGGGYVQAAPTENPNDDKLMYRLDEYLVGVSNSVIDILNSDACACSKNEIQYYKNIADQIFETGFLSSEAKEVSEKLQTKLSANPNCKSCPYVWDITYKEENVPHYGAGLEDNKPLYATGTSIFKNVFIYPRCDYTLSDSEEEVCANFRDNSTNESFSTYESNDGELLNNNETPATFHYDGLTQSGLCFRDPEGMNDTPLNELPTSYLEEGPDGVKSYARVEGWGQATYGNEIKVDIFEEVYKQKTFTVSTEKGSITFSHK